MDTTSPTLELDGLCKTYGTRKAVDHGDGVSRSATSVQPDSGGSVIAA
jgi:hypothetical protein